MSGLLWIPIGGMLACVVAYVFFACTIGPIGWIREDTRRREWAESLHFDFQSTKDFREQAIEQYRHARSVLRKLPKDKKAIERLKVVEAKLRELGDTKDNVG